MGPSAQHERDRAEHLRALSQRALDHRHVLRRGPDRAPAQGLAQGVEQHVAGRAQLAARASQARRVFRPSAAQAATAGRVTGRALAGTSDPALNAAMAFLCGLQVQAGSY